jgi:hypothetical protein
MQNLGREKGVRRERLGERGRVEAGPCVFN